MGQRLRVLVTEPLAEPAAEWLAQRCEVIECVSGSSKFEKSITNAVGLIVRTYARVDEELLSQAKKLRVVGRAGVGLDQIDVAECRRRNIEVVYTPDANTQAVVEYVLGLVCDALRPRFKVELALSLDEWKHARTAVTLPEQLDSLTLGILGMGRIGRRVAAVAAAIGFRVLFNDLLLIPEEVCTGAESVPVEALFSQSDVISIHIDDRGSNRKFVNERLVNLMKPGVVFINTSRGFVVDNYALTAFLRSHPVAQALLDVHEPEPFGPDYPFLGLRNARLYPHMAARTRQAMENMSWVVRDVVEVLQGRPPRFPAPQLH